VDPSVDQPEMRPRAHGRSLKALLGRGRNAAVGRTAGTAFAIRIANAGLAYVAQVILARMMGQFEYGIFAYTWVWFLVVGALSTFGVDSSCVRYIAQLRERGELDYLRGFLRFAMTSVVVTSVIGAGTVVAVLSFVRPMIGETYILPLALMVVAVPFVCFQSLMEGIGRSYGWTLPALVPVYILRHGFLLLFMVLAVALGFKANAVNGFVCVVLTIVVSLAYQAAAILLRVRDAVEPGPRAYRIREWVIGSIPFSVLSGFAQLSSFTDVVVLSFFVSPAEIAIYFAATRIIQVVNLIPFAATVGTAHLFSASHTRGDHEELKRLCHSVTITTFVIAALAVATIIAGGHLLLAMFGKGFAAGYPPLAILAIGVMARVTAGPVEDVLNMTGNGRLSASTYVVAVAFNVGLSMLLIHFFGISGAAVATSCTLWLRALWLGAAVRRRLGISPSIFAAAPSLGALWTAIRLRGSAFHAPAE
jgi:O-antigen/teichoic acid export membrane protein